MGVAALVLGILGTVLSIIPAGFWLGVPLAIIALILGIVGRKAAATNNQPTGSATAGMVLGIIGMVLGTAMWVMCAMIIKKTGDLGSEFQKEMQKSMEKSTKDPKLNDEFDQAFKKAMEEAAKQQQQQEKK